jgi:PAS domain S-box-containing protein
LCEKPGSHDDEAFHVRVSAIPQQYGRFALLIASVVVIVAAAWLVRQKVFDDTIDSMRWVAHTQEVRAAVFELTTALDEMRASALASQLDNASDTAEARYVAARSRYAVLLDKLRTLTSDSPEQQERIGMLRARISDRAAQFDELLRERTNPVKTATLLEATAARFPIEDIANALLAREEELLRTRTEIATRHEHEGRWLTLATSIAQILLLGIVIWVSERQLGRRLKAESETRRAIGRARLIVESVREPIAVIASDLGILQVNQAFADFYGLARPVSGSIEAVQGWSEDRALQQKLRDVSTTQRELWDYEAVQTTSADVRRTVLINARPMILPETTDTVALVTVSDLTARKRSEEQILELNRQLAGKVAQVTEVNRELEAFSYSVSHDLRAPLRHIAGFSEKLRSRIADAGDAKLDHYCEVIADSARRMSVLIEDLLSYSRLGRHALRFQPVDMQSLVDEARAILMSSVDGRDVAWRIAPLPVVVADASMLQLAWQNLLDNAIKYTAAREHALIEIGCDEADDERVFWIRDNGTGFDMRYVDKLFGVFQRLHKASAYSGSGIGLASVRRIISRHGGRTWAESVPDQGSTFYFSLPRHGPAS